MNSSMQQTAFMLKTARKLYVNLVVHLVRRIKNEMKKRPAAMMRTLKICMLFLLLA